MYLASALQSVDDSTAWRIAEGLATQAEDADDHNIPRLIWFGLEPRVMKDPKRALELARVSAIPMLTRHIVRRLTRGDLTDEVIEAITEAEQNQLRDRWMWQLRFDDGTVSCGITGPLKGQSAPNEIWNATIREMTWRSWTLKY